MIHCAACGKFLSPAGAATCSACPLKYHRPCLAISDTSKINKDWKCPNCKKNTRKGVNSQTPVKGICDTAEADAPLSGAGRAEGTSRSSPCAAIERTGDALLAKQFEEFRLEFVACMTDMHEFRGEMAKLRESLCNLTTRLTSVEHRLDKLEQQQVEGGNYKDLECTIASLKLELNDRDQDALLADLDIGQLPEEKGENVVHSVTALATRLGVTLETRDVVFAERVGAPFAPGGGCRRLVVRLARRQLRDELLSAARVRRTLTAGAGGRVYLNERLTRHNRQLFQRVREECRKHQWRYSWTKRGRIFARQGDGKPVFHFRMLKDLDRAFGTQAT